MSVPFQVECGCFAFLVELVVETACDGWVCSEGEVDKGEVSV